MYAGQLVFAQLMDHLPWKTFGRIVERYGGDRRIRELVWQGCVETPCRARHEPPGNAQTPPGGVGPWTWCCGLGNTGMHPSRAPPLPFDSYDDRVSGDDY